MKLLLWSIVSAANSPDWLVAAAVQKALDDGAVLVMGKEDNLKTIKAFGQWTTYQLGAIDRQDGVDWRTIYPETGE